MMFTFFNQIGLMRFFRCIKPTNNGLHPVSANSCPPSFTAFQFRNTKKFASFISRMRFFLILNITRGCYIPKIGKTIVARIAINMVNVVNRLFTSCVKPSKATSAVCYFVNTNNRIPFRFYASCNSAWNNFSASFYFPSKNTRFGGIMQKSTQLIKCDFVHTFSIL